MRLCGVGIGSPSRSSCDMRHIQNMIDPRLTLRNAHVGMQGATTPDVVATAVPSRIHAGVTPPSTCIRMLCVGFLADMHARLLTARKHNQKLADVALVFRRHSCAAQALAVSQGTVQVIGNGRAAAATDVGCVDGRASRRRRGKCRCLARQRWG